MGYTNFENGVTPLSDTVLNLMQTKLLMLAFPIGSTYITQNPDENPNSILEFGTWERFDGILDVGVNPDYEPMNEIGKTGGVYEENLTMYNLPPETLVRTEYSTGVGNNDFGQVSGWNNHALQDGEMSSIKPASVSKVQPFEVVGYKWIRRA